MAKINKVSQRKWIKGVVASAQDFAQPQGSHPRSSNLVLTRRGGLVTSDGSFLLTVFSNLSTGTGPQNAAAGWGQITELFLFQASGLPANYYGLIKSNFGFLASPTLLVVADGGAGGVLNGTYTWGITALDGAGGETLDTWLTTFAIPAGHKASLSWPAVPLATGYNIYRTAAGPVGAFLKVNSSPITATSYVDNIADGSRINTTTPLFNSTQGVWFFKLPLPTYSLSDVVTNFPADLPPIVGDGGIGGRGGGGIGGGTTGSQPPTSSGGVSGNISPIPQIMQFVNKMILILGNGYAPYQSDGTSGGTTALTNTFVASYPARTNSSPQVTGDLMALAGVLYKASQGGTTAAAPPAFNTALGQSTADGTVIWVSQGPINAVPAPRGAAHAIVYAGSLWIFNTSPDNTSDNFDGPSCLKMSDLNNPNSWNPLNVAFLDKDDGSQGMGLATFTIAESGIPPTGSLVAFKEFSTFQINGVFGASNFSIQRAQTDLGCVSPRSIKFVPGFGITRMTHLGIAVFDGVRDRLISEEIRPYIFGGLSDVLAVDWNCIWNARAAVTANPPMYVCAVPLIPSSTLGSLAVSSIVPFAVGNFTTTIPPGTYYAKLYMQDAQNKYYVSREFGPITITPGDCFQLNLTLPSNAVQLYFMYGTTPGGENTLVPISSTQFNNSNLVFNAGVPSAVPFTSASMLTRLLCYDLVLRGWMIIDLPFAICTLKEIRSPGTIPLTIMGGFSDMAMRRWQGGDQDWDSGATVAGASDTKVHWNVRSPEVFGKDSSDRVFFRQLVIRGKGSPSGIKTKTTINGISGDSQVTQNVSTLPMGGGEFIAYAELGITGTDAYTEISGSGVIEIDSLDWLAIAKAIRGRVTV